MDVMAMCSSTPISNQSDPRKIPEVASTVQNLPSPPLIGTANEKNNGSSLPLLTSILPSPVSPLHEINPTPLPPKSHHDISLSVVNHNLYHQSSIPQSTPSQITPNYLPPIDTTSSMWPPRPPITSNYHQSLPPSLLPQYPYVPQSQHQSTRLTNYYPRSTTIASDYLPPYPSSTSHTFTGSNDDSDNDSPYIQQTFEQSLVKMGRVVDYCNQIVHFALQYRDMKTNYNPWNGATTPQVTESHLENIINRAYDVLNIVSSLKGEITARPSSIELSQDEIDLIRKQRTLATYTRTKYRKRNSAAPPRRCHSCNITETPEWRRGPDGARTLCNACGLHFAKITRNRTLSTVQQTEQQQAASDSSNITSTASSVPEDNVTKSLSNNNNSLTQTSGASNVKQPIIEIIDD